MKETVSKHNCRTRGFTLMEILIVVVIIGVLAAIALPQYQKAVLKSRYSAMIPIAKSLATGNEAYYMEKGEYAEAPTNLDVSGQSRYPDGTQITMGSDSTLAYVLAGSDNTPGAKYVVYQKHSQNFPDNIHCEALDSDEKATWLCRDALHGTPVNTGDIKSISGDDYTAYVLSGSTVGSTFDKSCEGSAPTEEGDTCPSGCGKMTATASCNPRTGQWGEPEFNDASCPSPLPDDTQTCENGTGTKVRHSQCKADGSGYEYGAWDESGCCEGEKPTNTINGQEVECVNGQWLYKSFTGRSFSGGNDGCGISNQGGGSVSNPSSYYNAPNGGICSGTYTNRASCNPKVAYGCANSTFSSDAYCSGPGKGWGASYECAYSTFNSGSLCQGSAENACYGSTINSGAKCVGRSANGCAGAILKSGSSCWVSGQGGCDGAIFEAGSWCYENRGNCAAGTPAGSNSAAYAGQCWDGNGKRSASYCVAAGTPVGDSAPGKCWDGAGHQTDC